MFPHSKCEPEEYGHSPGNGITPISLSSDPLATEGEATPGPDDQNPYDEQEEVWKPRRAQQAIDEGVGPESDLFAFDEFGEGSKSFDLELPEPTTGPDLSNPIFDF